MTLRTTSLPLSETSHWLAALFVVGTLAGCGDSVTPAPVDLGSDSGMSPCEGPRPICRAMSTCGCDELVPPIVGSTCGGGCCPWICPAWSIEESSCLDRCGVDGGGRDAGPRDSGASVGDGGARDGSAMDAGPVDWRACTDQGQCGLAASACCDVCGVPTLDDVDAVRMGGEAAHYDEVCPSHDPSCPDCVTFDAPNLVATCESNACTVVDVDVLPLTACLVNTDCRVRTTSCCECGGDARYLAIAVGSEAERAYADLVCPLDTACLECAPVYPATLMPRCGADGHCTLATP